MKSKILIMTALLCLCWFSSCDDDGDCNYKPPKWELPQPIDTLLLGSWKAIEGDLFDPLYMSQIITFYENNKFVDFRKITFTYQDTAYEYENEHRWSVKADTLLMPDYYDGKTMHFSDYTYSLSDNENLLYVILINYPYVTCGDFPLDTRIMSLGGTKITFKKLEDE